MKEQFAELEDSFDYVINELKECTLMLLGLREWNRPDVEISSVKKLMIHYMTTTVAEYYQVTETDLLNRMPGMQMFFIRCAAIYFCMRHSVTSYDELQIVFQNYSAWELRLMKWTAVLKYLFSRRFDQELADIWRLFYEAYLQECRNIEEK